MAQYVVLRQELYLYTAHQLAKVHFSWINTVIQMDNGMKAVVA